MLGNKTPITYVTPGYKPDLDRLPPQGAGCPKGCLWMVILFILLVGGIVGAIFALSSNNETLETTIITTVPYGGASHASPTPTMDYCWFLTPTIEALPTIEVTPDKWQLKATDDSFLTGTPIATDLPTSEPPRAWCNETPVMDATATWTPFGIPSDVPYLEIPATATITDTPQPIISTAIPTAVPTSTLFPTLIPRGNAEQVDSGGTGSQVIVIQTVVVERVKVEKVVDEVVKIITATPRPKATRKPTLIPTLTATVTATDIPEMTEEPTIEPTTTLTATETATLTATPTNTVVPTTTYTATATYTHTPTATQTATDIPTSTLFPTLIPTATETETDDSA